MRQGVYWSPVAKSDLVGIIQYISENNPETARKIFQGLRTECAKLAPFPLSGRIVPELKKQNVIIYREILVLPWRIIYRVVNETIYILAVFDGRRDLQDVLLERILRS